MIFLTGTYLASSLAYAWTWRALFRVAENIAYLEQVKSDPNYEGLIPRFDLHKQSQARYGERRTPQGNLSVRTGRLR